MKTLVERILAARDLAAEREPDIRIKEFLQSMQMWPCGDGADPSCVTITRTRGGGAETSRQNV